MNNFKRERRHAHSDFLSTHMIEVLRYQDRRVHPRRLVTCMILREAGERHHDNAGGSRKLPAVAAGHTKHVKEKHYEKVGGTSNRCMGAIEGFIQRLWRSDEVFDPIQPERMLHSILIYGAKGVRYELLF